MAFAHIHLHTHYSKFDSINKPKEVVKRLRELGQTAWAVTDHGTTSGLIESFKETKKLNEQMEKEGNPYRLHFVFGVEFYVSEEATVKIRDNHHLILLAKNNEGYRNLLKLMTLASKEENFYHKPRIDFDMLKQHSKGLICTSACMGGVLQPEVKINEQTGEKTYDYARAKRRASEYQKLFGSDFYIELHTNTLQEQRDYNKELLAIAQGIGIQVVVACDSHYLTKADAQTHRAWIGIADDNESDYYQTDDYYVLSESEVRAALSYLPADVVETGINNTMAITNQCHVDIDFKTKHYPRFPVDNQLEYLKVIARKGWKTKIEPEVQKVYSKGQTLKAMELHKAYADRVNMELEVLDKADYINYFLITHDIIEFCNNSSIYHPPGRGSVTACMVSYLMDITKIDPIKYNLVFERFAHLERVTPPDIDCDVEQGRRGEVIEYIRQKYGTVYQVRTFGYMQAKGALKRAGQALKIESSLMNELSKRVVAANDKYESQLAALDVITEPEYKPLVDLAKKFVGIIQNTSVHASAVVVFPSDPTEFCAIEKQGDNYVAAYDFHDLEAMGILKQDILGLKTADVIHSSANFCGVDIQFLDKLELDDKKTFDMLCAGYTKGCFQIESHGMTELVKNIQPRSFYDLIPLVALYRPGTLNAGMVDVFVRRRAGEEEITYDHPLLEPILKDTYGVILYQEQIIEIARVVCGFTRGQADMLRRAVGRKEREVLEREKTGFVERGIKNGIPKETIEKIWSQIETFAEYGFNKGHSTAYGYISYQTAWLKANYPLEFMCALINSEHGKQDKAVPYIQEARRMGITILPPDINKSSDLWTIEDGCLRVGLTYIKGIGSIEFKTPVFDFPDFMESNNVNKGAALALIKAGCFPGDRGLQLTQLDWFKDDKHGYLRKQACLRRIEELTDEGKVKQVAQWATKLEQVLEMPTYVYTQHENFDEIEGEIEVLGFSFTDKLDKYDLSVTEDYVPSKIKEYIIGAEVVKFKKIKDKKKHDMAFVTLRTKQGINEFVMFFRRFKPMEEGKVYLVSIVDGKQITDCVLADKKVN